MAGSKKFPVTLLLFLLAIEALDANRRKQTDKFIPTTNICDINDRDSKVHCYCEHSQGINEAVKTECWVFNGGLQKTDSLWSSFTSQSNLETLAFNVRADGGLNFVPNKVLLYLRRLKTFSIKYSSISKIDSYTFMNLTSIQDMIFTKNKILILGKYSFYNLPNLTILIMDENRIEEIVTDTFYELPSLQKLYLTSNNISIIQDGAFRHLVNLLELELDKNNISELRKECFDGLANLKQLDLRKNKIAVLNSYTFTELWNLEELLLDHNEIYILAQRTFDGLSLLKTLSLTHNKLVSLVGGLFEGVRGLNALDLSFNKLHRFTYENLSPIYDNMKNISSYILLDGNDLDCDCHLAWMHRLRHEARNLKLRTSLEQFICRLNVDPSTNSHLAYLEQSFINLKNPLEPELSKKKKKYQVSSDGIFVEEIGDSYVQQPKIVRKENDRTLLQIPVELLPCPQEPKTVTDKTYTYPSQNEAIDYRNLIQTTASSNKVKYNVIIVFFLLLIQSIY